MAWGISGSDERSAMVGADVAVAHFDPKQQRGFATDYNITAAAPVRGTLFHTHIPTTRITYNNFKNIPSLFFYRSVY